MKFKLSDIPIEESSTPADTSPSKVFKLADIPLDEKTEAYRRPRRGAASSPSVAPAEAPADTLKPDNAVNQIVGGFKAGLNKPDVTTGTTPKQDVKQFGQMATEGALGVAPLAIPGGPELKIGGAVLNYGATHLLGAGIMGTFFGLIKGVEDLIAKKPLDQVKQDAVDTGLKAAGADLAIRGAGSLAYRGLKAGATALVKPIVESKAAREQITAIDNTLKSAKKEIGQNLTSALNYFKDRATQAKNIMVAAKATAKNIHTENIKKQLGSIDKALASIESDTNTKAFNMIDGMSKAIPQVKKAFNEEYSNLLSKQGKTPVNITEHLDELGTASGFNIEDKLWKSKTPKEKLLSVSQEMVKALPPADEDAKALRSMIAEGYSPAIAKKALGVESEDGVTLAEAHWLKLATYKRYKALANDPIKQQEAQLFIQAYHRLAEGIDSNVGGVYADVSGRYRGFKNVSDYVDSAIGPLKEHAEKRLERENVTTRLLNQTRSIVEKGGEITDEVYQSQHKAVKAFYEQADVLRATGTPENIKLADELNNRLSEIAKNILRSKSMQEGKSALKELLHDEPAVFPKIEEAYDTALKNIDTDKNRIASIVADKKEQMTAVADTEKGALQTKLRYSDEHSLIAAGIFTHSVARVAKTSGVSLDPIANMALALYGIKKYAPSFGEIYLRAVDGLARKIKDTPLPEVTRKAYLLFLDKISKGDQ